MKSIDEQFSKFEKSLVGTLIIQLSTLRLIGVLGVRDHIMRMMDIVEAQVSKSCHVRELSCSLHLVHPM